MIKHKLTTILLAAIVTSITATPALALSTIVTDAEGTEELWTYHKRNGVNRLTSKINQVDGKGITQAFDNRNNLTSLTDEEGRTTTYTYNATNQRTRMTEASGTSEARSTFYKYVSPDVDLVTHVISPSVLAGSKKLTIYRYDEDYNVRSVQIKGFDLAGNTVVRETLLSYDQYGRITRINGPRTDVEDVTSFSYYTCTTGGKCGQLKGMTNAVGHYTRFDSYDASGRVLKTTDSNNVVTRFQYHPRGWLLSINKTPQHGDARVTRFFYDNLGQLTRQVQPDGVELRYSYDAAHDLRSITDNLGNRTTYLYDAKGNRTQERMFNPDGSQARRTFTEYDIRNFVTSINQAGSITKLINDAVGNLAVHTDPNKNPDTQHTYDALDRVTQVIDALSNDTNYQYNVADQITQVQSANGSRTVFDYDDLGNQAREISPDRGEIIYAHDAAGNIIRMTDARGITRQYSYDALNRLTNVSYPDQSENIRYIYDARDCGYAKGRLCQVNDETGQTNYRYDAWGNITRQKKQELGKTYITRYQYDAADRVVQMTYPNGRVVDYQRDAIGRVKRVRTQATNEFVDVLDQRQYRADDQLTSQRFANGLQQRRTYDQQGRVTRIALGNLDQRDYQYDANGNILTIDKTQESRAYQYDVLDRLTTDRREGNGQDLPNFWYQYDANGNRTALNNQNYQYRSDSNRVTRDAVGAVSHDKAGNRLSYHGGLNFRYNQAGRLRQVTKSGAVTATYRYNAFGQRTRKELPQRTDDIFHYDLNGQLIMRSRPDSIPVEDYIWVDGELVQFTKTWGQANNGRITSEVSKTFIHSDHLLTPRLGTQQDQTVVWRWDNDAFNSILPDRDPDGDNTNVNLLLGFPGQYYDWETKLYYNWNRYYDPKNGRYITSDPIGLEGGLNTYGYVNGNPLVYADPNGLKGGKYGFCAILAMVDSPAPGPADLAALGCVCVVALAGNAVSNVASDVCGGDGSSCSVGDADDWGDWEDGWPEDLTPLKDRRRRNKERSEKPKSPSEREARQRENEERKRLTGRGGADSAPTEDDW